MPRLVEFRLEEGGTLLVQVPDADTDGQVTRGLRPGQVATHVADQAQRTFEEALDRVQPAAQSLIQRLRRVSDTPEEVHIEFGLNLHAEAGAFIAAASTEANFRVSLTWRSPDPPARADAGSA